VGTDFSNSAAAALFEARRLTERFGPAPVVIHAITCMAESLWEADATATHWLDSVSLAAEQVDARAGRPWLVLVHAAEELRASGIVLGSHGTSGYQPLRLGSVTARVSLIAPCPVVIVSARECWRSARDSTTHAEGDERRREWNG
jgi:nucleotide-binding universal stress UspA family protein